MNHHLKFKAKEEFNSPIDLDSDPIWTWSDGGLYEGAVRFVKEQISHSAAISDRFRFLTVFHSFLLKTS